MTFNAILERHGRSDEQRKEEMDYVVNRVKQMPGEFLGSVGRLGDGGLFEQESDTIDQFVINTWNNLDPKVKENIQKSAAKFAHAWEGAGKLDATGYNPFDYIGDLGAYGTVKALSALGKWWEWGHTVRSGILQLAGVDKGAADKIAISRQLLTGRAFPKARIPGVSTTITPYTQGINPVQVKKPPINVTPNAFTKTIDTVFKVPRFRGTSILNQKLLGEEMFNIPPEMLGMLGIVQTPKGPVQQFMSTTGGANYDPILGEDELTESFRPQWQRKARQGDKTFYYDITGHRILDVPGMDNPAQKTRYKNWLTNSLINRYNKQLLNPEHPFTHFDNQSFYDSQGMEWRLVRTDKSGIGPDQPYEPMPLNEIDSRKLKAENTSEEERVLLRELMKLNVTDRNALERQNPWLIQWNSDTSGQNYHEHMIGLDETEFWNSGAGKALGYMNNDVYDLEKGLGNIVFLNDPRFKIMKDSIAEYITPSSKEEVYPGLRRRINSVKTFTGGPYAGMNAVIGYDANPKSSTYTNLVIRAYNPSPDVNESQIVATIPNWYANVYAKDLTTGERIIPENIANEFIRSYVDAVLEGNEPGIVALEDLTEQLLKDYGIEVEIPAPGGLQQDPAYQSLGESTLSKPVDPDPLDLKTFKTTPKIQRARDRWWKKQFLLWKKGRYTQLELNLDEEFPDR